MRSILLLLFSLAAVMASASTVHAQDSGPFPEPVYGSAIEAPSRGGPTERPRLGVHMSLGAGGEVELDGTGLSSDADPSLGFGLRFLYPLLTYISVGGQVEVLYARAEGMPERDPLLDLQAVLEGRYPFRVGEYDIEAYIEMPVGLTILFPSDSALDNGTGLAISILFGGRIWLTDRIGLYTDIGWGMHHTHNDVRRVGGTVEPILRQMIFHVGAQLAL